MKTKLFFSIIIIVVIFAMGCTPVNNNSVANKESEKGSEIDSIIRPQDFGNGVFYFDTQTHTLGDGNAGRIKEFFGKSISHFIQHNPEWKVSTISPLIHGGDWNEIMGYFVVCEAVK